MEYTKFAPIGYHQHHPAYCHCHRCSVKGGWDNVTPELYEALKGILRDYSTNPLEDNFYMACLKAREALSSAEGK